MRRNRHRDSARGTPAAEAGPTHCRCSPTPDRARHTPRVIHHDRAEVRVVAKNSVSFATTMILPARSGTGTLSGQVAEATLAAPIRRVASRAPARIPRYL